MSTDWRTPIINTRGNDDEDAQLEYDHTVRDAVMAQLKRKPPPIKSMRTGAATEEASDAGEIRSDS